MPAVAGLWIVAIFAALLLPDSGAEPWLAWLALVLFAVSLFAAVAMAGGRIPDHLQPGLELALVALGAPVLLIVAALGGASDPSMLLFLTLIAGVAWRRGTTAGAVAAIAVTMALMALDAWLGRPLELARALMLGGGIAVIGVAPAWQKRRLARQTAGAGQRLARIEGYLADRRTNPHLSRRLPGDLRRESQVIHGAAEGMLHLDELDRYLRDVRDMSGADEVIFWRPNAAGVPAPVAWSTESAGAPLYFDHEEWTPHVKWSAEEAAIQCLGNDETAHFVSCPVETRSRLIGVLSMSAAAGLTLSRNGAKAWVERHAAQVALLAELFDIRREYRKDLRQTRALLAAARDIHENRSIESLGRAVCEAAINVTSGNRAALIRWDERSGSGAVQATSEGHVLQPGLAVSTESLLAVQCRLGEPVLKDDAQASRHAASARGGGVGIGGPVYGPGEPSRDIGSLAIVPMRRQNRIMGALVVEGESAGDLTSADLRNLGLLSAVVATSLEIAWEVEVIDRRARTDELTGLYNRRHLDEALSSVMADAERYGHAVSLIVADIDHFKRVNDAHGHEAGDAVLAQVARIFREAVRVNDICARYGGEELVVLLPHTPAAGARELAERLRERIESRVMRSRGTELLVTASFGMATFPDSASRRDMLFSAADRALYRAKEAGRNRVEIAPALAGNAGRSHS
ncbi:MAG: diguanylate cyclase [Gemmatimonadaceae bacterium]